MYIFFQFFRLRRSVTSLGTVYIPRKILKFPKSCPTIKIDRDFPFISFYDIFINKYISIMLLKYKTSNLFEKEKEIQLDISINNGLKSCEK